MMSVLRHWMTNAQIAFRRAEAIETFSRLSDLQLRDIGIERGMIESHVADAMPMQRLEIRSHAVLQPSMQGCG